MVPDGTGHPTTPTNPNPIPVWMGSGWTTTASAICPDTLRLCDLGEADGLRGRLVRAFFHLMRWIP